MRTRIEDNLKDVSIERYRDMSYTNNCSGQESTKVVENYVGDYRRTTDVVIPRFRERVANGELFFNPYNSYTETRNFESSGWSERRTTEGYQCYEDTGDGPLWAYSDVKRVWHPPGSVNIANLRNLAATSALAGVKKPEFASLVSLGELRETIKYVKNPLSSLTSYIRHNRTAIARDMKRERIYLNRLTKSMRRGSSRRTAERVASKSRFRKSFKQAINSNEVRAISDAYLGGRYGLRPLIGEVQSLLRAIDIDVMKQPPRETSRGFASDGATTIASGPSGSSLWWDYESQDTFTQDVSCSAGVLYSIDIRDTWGTDFSQVPVSLWETTFCSFMADWFANMGQFLAAVTPKSGIRVHGSWVTSRNVRDTERRYSYTFDPPYENCSEPINPSGTESVSSVNTRRMIGIKASLAYRPQGIRFDLGTARIADMFAIARNLLF